MLAHEFGHFAQSSMKLGQYVYVANQAIHDMVYARDRWDEWLAQWRRIDIRISFPAGAEGVRGPPAAAAQPHAGGRARELVPPSPKPVAPLRDGAISGEWLNRMLEQFQAVLNRLRRLHYKNLGALLALQDSLDPDLYPAPDRARGSP